MFVRRNEERWGVRDPGVTRLKDRHFITFGWLPVHPLMGCSYRPPEHSPSFVRCLRRPYFVFGIGSFQQPSTIVETKQPCDRWSLSTIILPFGSDALGRGCHQIAASCSPSVVPTVFFFFPESVISILPSNSFVYLGHVDDCYGPPISSIIFF